MGGNLTFGLEKLTGKRINSEEYEKISEQVHSKLAPVFERFHIPETYANKKSAGDLDAIVSEPIDTYTPWGKQIKEILGASYQSTNGDTCSYLVDGFQVDIKIVKPKYWETSVFFNNFSPRGNLIGRMARMFKLNFGHKGLVYRIYTENLQNRLDEVIVCQDVREICEFFDFDYNQQEFLEETDIFDWIIKSKYYSYDTFQFENLRHSDKTRNKKRPDYCRFLEYIETHRKIFGSWADYKFLPKERRDEYIPMISNFFNINLQEQIDIAREKYKKDLALYEKWNGVICMSLTGLKNKELGDCLRKFKEFVLKNMGGDYWKEFLERNDSKKIEKIFLHWYQNYCKLEK